MADEIQYLTWEDGIVAIGGVELPGELTQLTVAGQVKFDKAKSDGQSGEKKTPMGYEDAAINIDMELLTDENGTCYDKLTVIDKLYKAVGPKAAPKIVSVVNRHMRARQVEQVVFSGLTSREDNQSDMILVALTFTEHLPPVTTAEKRVVGKAANDQQKKAEDAKNAGGAAPPAKPKTIDVDAR